MKANRRPNWLISKIKEFWGLLQNLIQLEFCTSSPPNSEYDQCYWSNQREHPEPVLKPIHSQRQTGIGYIYILNCILEANTEELNLDKMEALLVEASLSMEVNSICSIFGDPPPGTFAVWIEVSGSGGERLLSCAASLLECSPQGASPGTYLWFWFSLALLS